MTQFHRNFAKLPPWPAAGLSLMLALSWCSCSVPREPATVVVPSPALPQPGPAMLPPVISATAELKVYLPFDEGVGTTTLDQTGTLAGTITGAVWVDGKIGKALQFNGHEPSEGPSANVQFDLKSADHFLHDLGGGAFSLTAWIKPDSTKDYRQCNEILNTGSDRGPGWRFFYSWRRLYFRSGTGFPPQGTFWEVVSNPALDQVNNDEWNFVAVTRNEAGIETLYLNGKQAAATPEAVTVVKNEVGKVLTIGSFMAGTAYGFKGIIDEVKIYQGALTQAEIYREATGSVRQSAIQLDGSLDEDLWAKATRFDRFLLTGGLAGESTKAPTQALLAYDREFIYVAFICAEPDLASLKKNITVNNSTVYRDDCVELMIDSDRNRGDFYHLIVNPLGHYAVLFHTQSGMVSSLVPEFRCQTGVKLEQDRWIVEMAIPYSSITLDRVKNSMAINLARTRRAGLVKAEESSICEKGAFNQSARFKSVELAGVELTPYALEVQYPVAGEVTFRGQAIQAAIQTSVKNLTAKERRLAVTVGEDQAGNIATFKLLVAPNEAKAISANLPIRQGGVFKVTFNITEGEKLIFDSTYSVKIGEVSPLSVELAKPFYRNSFYATQPADEITGVATLRLGPDEFAGSTVAFSLTDQAGTTIASVQSPVTSARQPFTVPLPTALATGAYTLSTKISNDQRQLAEQTTAIFKLPPAPGTEVRLARPGDEVVMYLNGKPFFPIWWWGGSPLAEIAKTGGDGVTMQVCSPAGLAGLDQLQALKQYGIVQFFDDAMMKEFFGGQSSLSQKAREHFLAMIKLVKDHPALLCYYLQDEPEVRAIDPRILEETYQLIRANDPYHPMLISNDSVEGIYAYKDAHELFMPDPYLCPQTDGTLTRPMTYISTFIDNAVKASDGKKLVGNTPQVFNYADYDALNNRAPTFLEERCAMYLAVIHGARAFSLFKYGDSQWVAGQIPRIKGGVYYPDLRVGMPPLIQEIKSLAEPLLLGKSIPAQASDPNLHLLLKRQGSFYYLFAGNVTDQPRSGELDLPAEITELTVVSEGRKIKLAAGKLKDEFKPYEVHVYTNNPDFTSVVQLDQIKADILKAGGVFELKYREGQPLRP